MAGQIDELPGAEAAQPEHRAESVNSLFTATMAGIRETAPHNISSLIKDAGSSQSWANTYEQTKSQLEQQGSAHGAGGAQAKIMMEQLETLNKMPAAERSAYLQGLSSNDSKLAGISSGQDDVRNKVMYSADAAINKQKDVVGLADQFNGPALQAEADSIKNTIAHNPGADIASLSKELDSAHAEMAAPFTERARLAMLQLKDGREVQAEETLDAALKAPVPKEAWSLNSLSLLRQDAKETRDELHVENNLLSMFDETINKLNKITGRQDISKSDFSAPCLRDPQFGALSKFLSKNYDSLTKQHAPSSVSGITRADVEKYVHERTMKLNDFVN